MIHLDYRDYLSDWLHGLLSEISFWENDVMNPNGVYHDRVVRRMIQNTAFKLDADLSEMKGKIKFLDVGSGPFSRCGLKSEQYDLDVIAVDPLAHVYRIMKEEYGLDNSVDLRPGFVEMLDKQFGEGEFDVVHMSNSLDHSFDAIYGLFELLYVCRIGGKVILRHHENEAEEENYYGLHQWNLSVHNSEDTFVIWRKGERYNISELFGDVADIFVYPDQEDEEGNWIYNKIVLVKREKVDIPKKDYYHSMFREMYNYFLESLLEENHRRNRLQLQNDFSRKAREIIAEYRNKADEFRRLVNERGYKKIDIYGAGKIGRELYALCMESGVKVGTLIDKNVDTVGFLPVVLADEYCEEDDVDLLVTTIEGEVEEVRKMATKVETISCFFDMLEW